MNLSERDQQLFKTVTDLYQGDAVAAIQAIARLYGLTVTIGQEEGK